jgi:protein SCO1/2
MTVRRRGGRAALASIGVALVALVACGGGGDEELVGYAIEPVPDVGAVTLPDLTAGGEEFTFAADPGGLLLVYFGYTHCPDACPGTLSNVDFARQRLDDPQRVQAAMVTVDPARDLDSVAEYVTRFVADGHALGTADDAALRRAANAFGVSYEVTDGPDGTPEVAHTTFLYAVDDTGHVILTWPFGVGIDDLAADLEQLLDGARPAAEQ